MILYKLNKKYRFITGKLAIEKSECWKKDYISVGRKYSEVQTDPISMTQPTDSFHTCTAKGSKRVRRKIKILALISRIHNQHRAIINMIPHKLKKTPVYHWETSNQKV
jgi:hypothetical protein